MNYLDTGRFDATAIRREYEYEHAPPNVVYLNTAHGRANARQAAQLLEEDRALVRDDIARTLMRERNQLMDRVHAIDAAMEELLGHG